MCATVSAGAIAILVILAYSFRRKFSFYDFVDFLMSKTRKFQNVEDLLKNYGSLAPKRYSYSEVKKMTNSFKVKLGQGGYGSVYKGEFHDGSPIAVTVLKEPKGRGEEFINEVASIGRTSHVNIVNLLGFCFQGRQRAPIYEFMPNGSLDKRIDQGDNLGLDAVTKEEENVLARKIIIVSLWCIQTDPLNRPSSTKMVEMLEGSIEALQIPPKPFLSSPSRTFEGSSTINIT
ncbi:hypothetical protein ACH5RR_030136 [Cinchona calisaya]|uniref:Protein kinase domain-containing protein n=1 Tax=Cinchona calisaya TaxID=153742 RepID=A0ABD2YX91_9GENT